MEDHDHLVRQLISALRDDMSEAGRELKNRSAWDLQCPIVIIDARTKPHRIVRTSVRGITGAIATSNVIDDPLMRSFLERFREVGADEALDEFMHGSEAERFADLWDIYNDETQQQGLAVWSHSDAAKFVLKSKSCFDEGQLACIAITKAHDRDAHDVLTFSVDACWLS
ncbi:MULTISPECIES: hypothetical protein [unclassified Synechococcus]|uniref:hypothetical protein n=1 Tax=unclassified Synechococcus TaxID=2626047 RepID=UPI001CF7EE0F|nr:MULTISPECIES: hypothetical protein [unclassified Synechococcus]MCB4376989.1 hypothetical protein [Synechococcus sp. MU1650]MCB4410921.1 hypothetical protein [Synechococcus sp. MU1611]